MSTTPIPAGRTVAGIALAAALLTGCGGVSPGVAAKVGDERISSSEVETVAEDYCQALETQLASQDQVVPHRLLAGVIAGRLALRSAATQFAAEYDVESSERYDQAVEELLRNVETLPEKLRESVIAVETTPAYVEDIQGSVGDMLLEDEGEPPGEYPDQVARGLRAFDNWVSANDIEFDPRLGIDLVEGNVEPVDTSVSYAFGEQAKAGAAAEPDPAYASSLPDSQRCG